MRPSTSDMTLLQRQRLEIEELLGKLLWAQLSAMGSFAGKRAGEVSGAPPAGLDGQYRSWFRASVEFLEEQGHLRRSEGGDLAAGAAPPDLGALWQEWEDEKRRWTGPGHYGAHVRLAETCVRALPEILTGKRPATDVLFPNGSVSLVEEVYRDNPGSDLLNDLLSDTLVAYVEARLARDPGAKLRIIEIGAGTGGTTCRVLPKLVPFAASIDEYGYTDVSRAFLQHAETHFCPRFPFVSTAIFDVGEAIGPQAARSNHYDVAIAASVLHATRSVRHALRNAKAVLRNRGLLLLNEISDRSIFAHVTFGLLSGWWLHEDSELRIPGSPALSQESWARVLEQEIGQVRFPAGNVDGLGQLIVVAESDGVVRQPRSEPRERAPEAAKPRGPLPPAAASQPLATERKSHVRKLLRDSIRGALKVEDSEIYDDRSFADYGVDSIVAVRLVNSINERCGIRLKTTDLFDYSSVNDLADHIVAEHAQALDQARCGQPVAGEAPPEAPSTKAAAESHGGGAPSPTRTTASSPVPRGAPERPAEAGGSYFRLVLRRPGEVDDLEMVEDTPPALGPHDVRVAVHAFSLSFGDLLCVRGLYPTMPPYPFSPGVDASGVVVEVGALVRSVSRGDAVIAVMGEALGAHATMVVCAEHQVMRKPERLSLEEACALPGVAISALEAFHKAAPAPGERVLIQTAAGGVGLILVQLARHAGAEIFATAGSQEKLDYLRSLGVHHGIDYRQTDFAYEVRRLTRGEGVDAVINTLAGDAMQKGLACLRAGGRYVELAMTGLKSARSVDLSALSDNQSFFSVDLRKLNRARPERLRAYRDEMLGLVERGVLSATLSEVVDFAEYKRAYRLLADRRNIGKVVVSVGARHRFQLAPERTSVEVRTPAGNAGLEPIAVIGMSGRFAKSETLDELWQHLSRGDDLVETASRWDLREDKERAEAHGRSYCDQGSFLGGIDRFDPIFFNISGLEASSMDPQQRLFLEEAWKALEDSGYATDAIRGKPCGVYVGCSAGDYHTLLGRERPPQSFWGNATSVIPARISYYLDLRGPAIGVDTACSSSLVAIHLACQALRAREIECALAGGVFLQCTPAFYRYANDAGMLSGSGRCRVFDEKADGFVPGEGVGAVVLKRLSDAIADRDTIHAVIRASGINQDGSSNGITAPSRQSQLRLQREVYERFGVDPGEIQMVEAHGTGTPLGDPIEYEALTQSFRAGTDKIAFCAIGSVKSNMGHAAAAAGIAGVLKTILALKHRQIPPSIHYEKGNPRIAFEDTPFYVNVELRDWRVDAESRRRAAVSSFGFGGTNAHLVLEEAPELSHPSPPRPGYVAALSARTAPQLRRRVEALVDFCASRPAIDMGNLSYTLLLGRKHWNHRLALVVRDRTELLERLRAWLDSGSAPAVHTGVLAEGEAARDPQATDPGSSCIQSAAGARAAADFAEHAGRAAELYVRGHAPAFEALFAQGGARIPLPLYPFARDRYWAVESSSAAGPARAGAPERAKLHPLVHVDASDASGRRYEARFDGDELFFADHVINEKKVLPGAALLEMARAAALDALRGAPGAGALVVMKNVVWVSPVVAEEGGRSLRIALELQGADEAAFEITSAKAGSSTVHCQGVVTVEAAADAGRLDVAELRARTLRREIRAADCYDMFRKLGVVYGASHQAVETILVGDREVLARLRLPEHLLAEDRGAFVIHPALLDSALQAGIGLMAEGARDVLVPFSIERLEVISSCPDVAWAWVRPSNAPTSGRHLTTLDVDVCDVGGRVCLRLRGYMSRALGERALAQAGAERDARLLAPTWRVTPEAVESPERAYARHWVLVCDPERLPPDGLRPGLGGATVEACHGGERDTLAERCTSILRRLFSHVKGLLAQKPESPVLNQVVVTGPADRPIHAAAAAMLRAAHHENPNVVGQVIEVDELETPAGVVRKLDHDRRRSRETSIRYRGDERTTLTWEDARGPAPEGALFRPHGVYLISGGLGGVGRSLAREILAVHTPASVVLAGRSALNAKTEAELRALSANAGPGSRVDYLQVDVRDRERVRALMGEVKSRFGGLHGVFHCAGEVRDKLIVNKDVSDFDAVLSPKIDGTIELDEATKDVPLDFFVLFSSVAAPLGSPGQADYAAANAFMDAYAEHREGLRRLGQRRGRSLSVDWPLWLEGGMPMSPAAQREMERRTGQMGMSTQTGLALLERALRTSHPQCLAAVGDASKIRDGLEAADAIRPVQTARPADPEPREGAAVPRGELGRAQTLDYLKELLCPVLKLPAYEIDGRASLDHYGIDSVMIVLLTNRLEEVFGSLPKTLFFEYRTLEELAEYFLRKHAAKLPGPLAGAPAPQRPAEPAEAATPSGVADAEAAPDEERDSRASGATRRAPHHDEGIAIVGLSGRYPQAYDLAEYWENLRAGRDCITEVPRERWDWRDYAGGDGSGEAEHHGKWGGFIDGVDQFDPLFFGVSPKEAVLMDPQERLFLEHVWTALEDAGYTRAALREELGGKVGVYAGVMYGEYQMFGAEATLRGRRMGFASSLASIANRVSYVLDLHGPSMTVDTMCSSSLTTLHFACQELKLGRIHMGIAGGVNLTIHPNKYLMLGSGQFLSSRGRCESFGEGGDGYVPGEGVGVAVLKRLSDALRDGDHVYGVIRGTAINHGGKTNGYAVPNPSAQQSVIAEALADAGIEPRAVSYVEAHGTGTKLGDPIEIVGLGNAFGPEVDTPCLLGSVKSNIGHCEAAAGIAGATKVLLQMQHGEIVPSLHSETLNPRIDFEATRFRVNQTLRPWERLVIAGRELPRIAGVSSFGAGGANAHIVLEEYRAPLLTTSDAGGVMPAAIPLSAREDGTLRTYAEKLSRFLQERAAAEQPLELRSLAYTLQVGREAMRERLGLVVSSAGELVEKLSRYVANGVLQEGMYRGQAPRSPAGRSTALVERFGDETQRNESIEAWLLARDHERLLSAWCHGVEIDWRRLHGRDRPSRVSLPTYPFAKESYWVPREAAAVTKPATAPAVEPATSAARPAEHAQEGGLAASRKVKLTPTASARHGADRLSEPEARVGAAPAPSSSGALVEVSDRGQGVFWVEVWKNRITPVWSEAVVDALRGALAGVAARAEAKIVVVQGLCRAPSIGAAGQHELLARHSALRTSMDSDLLTVALLEGDAGGVGLLVASSCDFMILGEGGRYPYHDGDALWVPGESERAFVYQRFGAVLGSRLLYSSGSHGAATLASRLSGIPIVARDQVVARGEQLARQLAEAPRETLVELKKHGLRTLKDRAAAIAFPEATFSRGGEPASSGAKSWPVPFESSLLTVHGDGRGVAQIEARPGTHLSEPLLEDLGRAIAALGSDPAYRVLILRGTMWREASRREPTLSARVLETCRRIAGCEIPVIAATAGGADGLGWLLAMACDEAICDEDGLYSLPAAAADAAAAVATARVARARLGDYLGMEVLLSAREYTGRELASRSPGIRAVASDGIAASVEALCGAWAELPREYLHALKREMASAVREILAAAAPGNPGAARRVSLAKLAPRGSRPAAHADDRNIAVDLGSEVVRVDAYENGVAVITLCDRENKNNLSEALVEGIVKAFEHVRSNDGYKVVIVTGFDGYFACGGTKASLLAVHGGASRFTDVAFYDLPLQCPVPVISAMQGHGIGAGWSMGMFADFAVFSEESTYESPYLRYGFTPGAGATLIMVERFGEDLAREILFTAKAYKGRELKERGIRMPVVPRAEVLAHAMELADRIASRPRSALVGLKQELSRALRERVGDTYQRELAMHQKTFVGSEHVLKNIEAQFRDPQGPKPRAGEREAAASKAASEAMLAWIQGELRESLARELEMKVEAVVEDLPFSDMGLDSISGATWVKQVNKKYGLQIETPMVYDHPTLREFTRLVVEVGERAGAFDGWRRERQDVASAAAPAGAARADAAAASSAAPLAPKAPRSGAPTGSTTPIGLVCDVAIVGMAGRFPKARDLDEFWQNIAGGRNCISEVPDERWSMGAYYDSDRRAPGKTYSKWMGVLEDADRFDPRFFNISPLEAEYIDPQQRVFLQTCWHTIEDAGYDPRSLSGTRCGVFVGCAAGDYGQMSGTGSLNAQRFMGSACSILAARIAYFLNLQGPCLSIDTACSSSLVALAEACDSLLLRRCDAALVGGVCVLAGPGLHIVSSKTGMLSADGLCRPFDQGADGFAPGEGVGVVFIKRLEDAQRDGDSIHGILRGWGVNQDGKTNGITAPNAESQQRLEREVYERCGVSPADLQLVEAHGTGTKLGDPIEFNALKASFAAFTDKQGYCALGSVKSNIGHLAAAAGIAGLLKVVMALRHRKLPPTINFRTPNEHIETEGSPFYVNVECRDWAAPDCQPRRAAVSAFGFSGTNVHIVVEEGDGVSEAAPRAWTEPQLIVLSARHPDQLRAAAVRLRDHVLAEQEHVDQNLESVAYTLQVGRDAMKCRLGFLAGTAREVADKLTAYAEGREGVEGMYRGDLGGEQVSIGFLVDEDLAATVETWIAKRKYAKLLELWVKGGTIDWSWLHAGARPRRARLPGYAFAEERYWLAPAAQAAAPPSEARALLHPLLHENLSNPHERRFRSTFRGDEFFLADHVIVGERVLPGVAILEMVRAAAERAAEEATHKIVQLENVVWVRPFVAGKGAAEIDVVLTPKGDARFAFEVISRTMPQRGEATVHSAGTVKLIEKSERDRLDLPRLREEMRERVIRREECYAAFLTVQIAYGDAFQAIDEIFVGGDRLLARLELPRSVAETLSQFVMHPSLVDACLHSSIGLTVQDAEERPSLPFALGSLEVLGPCVTRMWAYVRRTPGQTQANLRVLDMDLCDEAGKVCVRIRKLSSRVLAGEVNAAPKPATLLLQPVWEDAPAADGADSPQPGEHVIALCELPDLACEEIEAALPLARCVGFQSNEETLEQRFQYHAIEVFERVKDILTKRPRGSVLVQVVVPAGAPELLALSAILQTAAKENPALQGQVIAMDAAAGTRACVERLRADGARPREAVVRYVGFERQVLRWRDVPARDGAVRRPWRAQGVYLVTGGLGGIGASFAKEILLNVDGAAVVLVGRSPGDREKLARLREATENRGVVEYQEVDVSDRSAVRRAIREIVDRFGALHGVLHSAGILHDNFIIKKSVGELRRVFEPKVFGTALLDQETQALDLDFFALFSSGVGVSGNPGQADYAAANAFMDAYAAHRHELVKEGRRRGRTVSIDWPLWRDGGMHVDGAVVGRLEQRTGVAPMETETGIQAFYRALEADSPQIMLVSGDVERLRVSELVGRAAGREAPPATLAAESQPASREKARSLREHGVEQLKTVLASVLKLPLDGVRKDESFASFGIDSLIVMQLTEKLEDTFGALPKTLFFEYNNVDELADYLVDAHPEPLRRLAESTAARPLPPAAAPAREELAAAEGAPQPVAPQPPAKTEAVRIEDSRRPAAAGIASARSGEPLDVAVIGLAGRYPAAENLEELWDNLSRGRDCIAEIPAERWDWRKYYSEDRTRNGYHHSRYGGFIEDVDKFDAQFFGISPRVAPFVDPQERLFLEQVWSALEDAGVRPEQLSAEGLASQVGVYVGVLYSEYQLLGAEASMRGSRMGLSVTLASIANRISHALNLKGPSMVVDTVCSSSLTAIHLACQDLKSGRVDVAISGGVNLSIHPNKYHMLSMGQFLSNRGRCESFGAHGEGYVPGEGVGAILLKRLADAERDGDRIYGVIKGSALNHGGRAYGYNVPNASAQAEVISRAIQEAGIGPRDVTYIEAHGTGTQLGDPVEIAGLVKAFNGRSQDRQYCWIGSVKSNIGHPEAAAGIAAVSKVLLQMKHRQIAPSLHSAVLNPKIDFAATPFVVNQELRDWDPSASDARPRPRIAGVSSFGAGGSNAHLVIQEYAGRSAPAAAAAAQGPSVVVLSARNADRLDALARNLLLHLQSARRHEEVSLADVAYTLQVGRDAMSHRAGVVVRSVEELEAELTAFLENREAWRGKYQAGVKDDSRLLDSFATREEETIARWFDARQLPALLDAWVKGAAVEWNRLYPAEKPRRIGLPAYPFERKRYWITDIEEQMRTEGLSDHDAPRSVRASSESRADVARGGGRLSKPTAIALADPPAMDAPAGPGATAGRTEPLAPATSPRVKVQEHGGGIVGLRVSDPRGQNVLTADLVEELGRAARRVASSPECKVIVLSGREDCFLSGKQGLGRDLARAWLLEIGVDCPVPVIAAMQGDASGLGLMVGAMCDFAIFAREGRYGYSSAAESPRVRAAEREIFCLRFGHETGQALALWGREHTGEELAATRAGLRVRPRLDVERDAHELAEELAKAPREALVSLKAHLSRSVAATARALMNTADDSSAVHGGVSAHHQDTRELNGSTHE